MVEAKSLQQEGKRAHKEEVAMPGKGPWKHKGSAAAWAGAVWKAGEAPGTQLTTTWSSHVFPTPRQLVRKVRQKVILLLVSILPYRELSE